MRLKAYLTANTIGPSEFARTIDVSVQTVFRYLAGGRVPRPAVMARIVAATGGKVQPNDFHPGIAATCPCAAGASA